MGFLVFVRGCSVIVSRVFLCADLAGGAGKSGGV